MKWHLVSSVDRAAPPLYIGAESPEYDLQRGGWSVPIGFIPDPNRQMHAQQVDYTPAPPTVSKVRFMFGLWRPEEWLHAKSKSKDDPVLAFYLGMINDPAVTVVDLADPGVQQAINYILDICVPDVLSAENKSKRRAQILIG